MNTFKRKPLFFMGVLLALVLGGCASDQKRYEAMVQDTNDRIERMRKADADADAALAKVLEAAATAKPELAAMAVANIMTVRALKGGAGAGPQGFVVPERPRSFSEEARAWVQAIAPFALMGYQANRAAAVSIEANRGETQRFIAGEHYETARVNALANMAIGLKPDAPNVTNTYSFGRDGVLGGSQANDNRVTCTAGNGATGGAGGSGGAGGTAPGGNGSAGAAGGSGGDACR